MMKKLVILLVASMMLLATFAGGVLAAAEEEQTAKETLIFTSATGEVKASPDRVELSFAVETENADARIAQQQNAQQMAAVFSALEQAGISRDDLKTTGYSIYPVYEDTRPFLGPTIKTYRVTNTLLVTLKDVSRAGEIIDLVVGAGANQVNYISFTLSEEQQKALRSRALQDAMERSRSDADVVAASAGLTIVSVKEITVSGRYYPPVPIYRSAGVAESAAVTPIDPGDVTVSASVSVTYLCN